MSSRRMAVLSSGFDRSSRGPTLLDKLARRIVLSRLKNLADGQLVVSENGYKLTFGQISTTFPEPQRVTVLDPAFYSDIAFGGAIGSGEAYMQNFWTCDDLSVVLRMLLRNRDVLEDIDTGFAAFTKYAQKVMHFLNKNTRGKSRKNIAAHYDIGNDFYKLWLDSTMMYSSAYFASDDATLHDASVEKLDRICRRLDLSSQDSVVEIGTGWGGFAIHAAKHYGCHVTTTTISQQQFDFAKQAVLEAGLEDKVTLLCEDYRDLEGSYDKLVSIEMIEAVGHQFHETFFRKCCDLLRPDGQMLLQTINIADQRYKQYKNGVDFIKRYIFPGGCLTSVTDMTRTLTQNTDMRVVHLDDIGVHYAKTLKLWRQRFFAKLDEVRQQGYSNEFIGMWEYYLCYCEVAFTERVIGDVQMHIIRPDARPGVSFNQMECNQY